MKKMDMRKTRFEISADELEARMEFKDKTADYPRRCGIALLEVGLDKVLKDFGINVEVGDIPLQCEVLGIVIAESPPDTPEGFHILRRLVEVRTGKVDYIPHAWVGGVDIDNLGHIIAKIQWFAKNWEETLVGPRMPEVES